MAGESKLWFEVWDRIANPDAYYVRGTLVEKTNYMLLLNEEHGYPDNIGGNIVYKFAYRELSADDVRRERPRANGGVEIRDVFDDLKERVVAIRADRLEAEMAEWDTEDETEEWELEEDDA